MKVTVFVSPKKSVLDPQGAAVGHAMQSLGFSTAENVRVGKTVTFEVRGTDDEEFRHQLQKICRDLLSNPVIEDFRYEIEEDRPGTDS